MEMDPSGIPQVPCFDVDLKEVMWAASVCIECPNPAPCQMFCSQGVNIPKIIYRTALMLSHSKPEKKQTADSGPPTIGSPPPSALNP